MITKQQLGNFLWGMADILYGKVEDYKSYILTLLFYKRLSDNYPWEEEQSVRELKETYGSEMKSRKKKQLKMPINFKSLKGNFGVILPKHLWMRKTKK